MTIVCQSFLSLKENAHKDLLSFQISRDGHFASSDMKIGVAVL